MGIRDKLTESYTKNYLKKYGDRITQEQGKVLSVKIEEKSVLWIFHKIMVSIIIKPERSRNVVKCYYKKNRWFKKPKFMNVSQGNSLIIQGLKPEKAKSNKKVALAGDSIEIMNVINMNTKQQLVKTEGTEDNIKKLKDAQKVKFKGR
jgi:hypothetical protein